ncbi:MAG: hypothetical protein JO149_02225 [Gammaproteobacteria bacterium]|nr:hypothetical protein [Gammaproteobacteria bacterium]
MQHLSKRLFLLALLSLYVFAVILQSILYLNPDVSWLMSGTRRLLAGGTYLNDFFELNAPLILYLYVPPVLIAEHFHLPIYFVLPSYIFLLATLSLGISFLLIQKICSHNLRDTYLFTLVFALVFLILPIYEFGQREHLFFLLTFPYLLTVVCRMQGYKLKPLLAVLIGVLAGLGFAIKPFFIFPLLFVESYTIFFTRNLWSWIRLETISIFAVFLLYIAGVFIFHQDYLSVVVPFALRIYNTAYGVSFMDTITYFPFVFCGFSFLFYLAFYNNHHPYKVLGTVLLLALLGFSLTYITGHNVLYYHVLPVISISLLIMTLCLILFFSMRLSKKQYAFLLSISILSLAFCFFTEKSSILFLMIFRPYLFSTYFAIIFSLLLYVSQRNKNIYTAFSFTAVVIFTGFIISYMTQRSSWYPYQLFLTVSIMFMLMSWYFLNRKQPHYILITFITISMFIYPFVIGGTLSGRALAYHEKMRDLERYLQKNAYHRPVFFFTLRTDIEYPVTDYVNLKSISRFASLGWICDLTNLSPSLVKTTSPYDLTKRREFFVDITIDDLNRYKPFLVFVDVMKSTLYVTSSRFDFLSFYLRYPRFQALWKNYHYVTTLKNDPIYRLQVYQRNS